MSYCATSGATTVAQQIRVLDLHLTSGIYPVTANSFDIEPKIYDALDMLDLRRVQRVDGTSFMSCFLDKLEPDEPPVAVGVELRLSNQRGCIAITMRRVASKPDSWYCSSSTIHLPPDAAADLAECIASLGERLRH